jgi:HAMP domain-containing protein
LRSDDLLLFGGVAVIALPVFAVSARIMLRAATDSLVRVREASHPRPAVEPPAHVAMLQREVEELRAQVERMGATESFYTQLQAPAGEMAVQHTE